MTGIQNYKLQVGEIGTKSSTSATITPNQQGVSKVVNGSAASHVSVTSQLAALNAQVACATITFALIGQSTSQLKSVTDKSVLQTGQCYTQSTAEAIRALLEASYNANITSFSSLSNILTNAQTSYSTNVTNL